jgi:predicted ribosomally synthesized peptide with SipW-like signal peptide
MLKKKISTIATFIVAGALLAGAGTYAWFTQQES